MKHLRERRICQCRPFLQLLVCAAISLSVAGLGRAVSPTAVLDDLHQTIMLRKGPDGKVNGAGETDPLLWEGSVYFLSGESRARLEAGVKAVEGLTDEQVRSCPAAQRVLLQNRLWAVFDYLFGHFSQIGDGPENGMLVQDNRRLLKSLAEVMAKLALDDGEIKAMSDSLIAASSSGRWPAQPDAEGGPGIYLPPDLGTSNGRWTTLVRSSGDPIAPGHLRDFGGRSIFTVLARFPDGALTAEAYFKAVAEFSLPWLLDVNSSRPDGMPSFRLNPDLPAFPAGTQFALIRRLQVVDRQGRIRPTPLTLTVQLRLYHLTKELNGLSQTKAQSVAEFRLETDGVAAGQPPRLRPVTLEERVYSFFQVMGGDQVDGSYAGRTFPNWNPGPRSTALVTCYSCHGTGLGSINSLVGFRQPPFRLGPLVPEASRESYDEAYSAASWKMQQADWGALEALWPG